MKEKIYYRTITIIDVQILIGCFVMTLKEPVSKR